MLDLSKPYTIVIAVITALLLLAGGYVIGYRQGAGSVRADWTEERLRLAQQALAAEEAARAQEAAWVYQQQKSQEALQHAVNKINETERAGRAVADGLRGELATLRRKLSASSDTACARSGAALADVFGGCVAKYRDLARDADQCVAERHALISAWPQFERKEK
jgi:hypothetical protein